MHPSRLIPLLICHALLLPAAAGCTETLDRAAEHEHELIDHEYDRQDQLVDRIFVRINEVMDHQQDHHLELFDRMLDLELELFKTVVTAEPPRGFGDFGPSTCSFSSEPSGAEVFARNIFDEWDYVGRTPLVVERPLTRAQAIELRAPGHATQTGYMLSDRVQGPCEEHFVLAPVSTI